MPRVNIEEKWWSDPRRMLLTMKVGAATADGVWLNAIRAAQEYKGKPFDPEGRIPHEWVQVLLEVGLVCLDELGLCYVRGSTEHFAWLKKRAEAGSKGGKAAALLEFAKQTPSKLEQTQPSSSSSSSSSVLEHTPPSGRGNGDEVPVPSQASSNPSKNQGKDTAALIGLYCDLFKARYGDSPPIGGKQAGIIRRLLVDHGEPTARRMIEGFLQIDGERGFLASRRHDLSLLESSLNQITVALHKGEEKSGVEEAAARKTALLYQAAFGTNAIK